jgi:hypothetical protein
MLKRTPSLISTGRNSMTGSRQINCAVHGWQEETFVCQHIAESLHTGVPVGFHWAPEETAPRPDAWCAACEEARVQAGGWTPEVEKSLGVKLLCAACWDYAKSISTNQRKITQ